VQAFAVSMSCGMITRVEGAVQRERVKNQCQVSQMSMLFLKLLNHSFMHTTMIIMTKEYSVLKSWN
jgi:hypothetical protein